VSDERFQFPEDLDIDDAVARALEVVAELETQRQRQGHELTQEELVRAVVVALASWIRRVERRVEALEEESDAHEVPSR
jgi:hypothetical protein